MNLCRGFISAVFFFKCQNLFLQPCHHLFLRQLFNNLSLFDEQALVAAPAIAISACFASPGPFTAQPIIATFTSQFMVCRKASISFTTGCISHAVLPQVGQAIKFGVFFNKPQHFNSCLTIVISFTGSPLTLMRIVSPIPSFNNVPSAMLLLIALPMKVPASVTPRCNG